MSSRNPLLFKKHHPLFKCSSVNGVDLLPCSLLSAAVDNQIGDLRSQRGYKAADWFQNPLPLFITTSPDTSKCLSNSPSRFKPLSLVEFPSQRRSCSIHTVFFCWAQGLFHSFFHCHACRWEYTLLPSNQEISDFTPPPLWHTGHRAQNLHDTGGPHDGLFQSNETSLWDMLPPRMKAMTFQVRIWGPWLETSTKERHTCHARDSGRNAHWGENYELTPKW